MTEGIKRPFLIRIPALYNPDTSMTIEEIYAMQKPWRDDLHETIRKMQPRQKTPEEIEYERYQAHLEKTRQKMFPYTRKVLETIRADPFLTKTQLKGEVGGSKLQFEKSIEILEKLRLIEPLEFALKTNKAEFFPLTDKAHDLMESTTEDRKRCPLPEYFIHRLVNHSIFLHLQSFGLNPKREFTIKGSKKRSDNAVKMKRGGKDHLLGIEAMITDLDTYLNETLKKCMNEMMMDELIIVTKNADDRDKAKDKVKETTTLTEGQKSRVSCMSVKEFLTSFDPTA